KSRSDLTPNNLNRFIGWICRVAEMEKKDHKLNPNAVAFSPGCLSFDLFPVHIARFVLEMLGAVELYAVARVSRSWNEYVAAIVTARMARWNYSYLCYPLRNAVCSDAVCFHCLSPFVRLTHTGVWITLKEEMDDFGEKYKSVAAMVGCAKHTGLRVECTFCHKKGARSRFVVGKRIDGYRARNYTVCKSVVCLAKLTKVFCVYPTGQTPEIPRLLAALNQSFLQFT
ncbi:MAG: hypothetical protein KGL39_51680, partial [Patescibacteria group bacterium]|nr:hypothetical protein [Patescibacteria group bacterium]